MTSCLTSRLGAVRYLEEVLIPRLSEKGVDMKSGLSLPEFTQEIIELGAVETLLKNEFPPSCLKNILPCIETMQARDGAIWHDAFEQVVRTLLTAKLYLDAKDEGEIARKMAAIQRLACTLETFFVDESIHDFVGGIREALASVPRYTRDPELTFAACAFFETHKSLDDVDVDAIIDTAESVDETGEKPAFLFGMFEGYESQFKTAVEVIQSANPD